MAGLQCGQQNYRFEIKRNTTITDYLVLLSLSLFSLYFLSVCLHFLLNFTLQKAMHSL